MVDSCTQAYADKGALLADSVSLERCVHGKTYVLLHDAAAKVIAVAYFERPEASALGAGLIKAAGGTVSVTFEGRPLSGPAH